MSSDQDDGNVDFDTQLRLEQVEAASRAAAEAVAAAGDSDSSSTEPESARDQKKAATRTDEDGTVFDWDESKQAWFPRIDSEMLIRYQLGYGADNPPASQQPSGGPEFDSLPPEEQEKARQYWEEYYSSQEYRDWYDRVTAEGAAGSGENEDGQSSSADQQEQQQQSGKKRDASKKKKSDQQQQQQWFEVPEDQNTHVFVQNLPLDMTESEFIEFMSKCGMVLHDPLTRRPKVKLYTDESTGKFNGSARCGYIKRESVALALQILDGYRLKSGEVSVELAKFQPKAGFDASKRRKLTNKEKKKVKEHQARLLAWAPSDSAASADGNLGVSAGANAARRSDRVLIVSNAFSPTEFDSDPLLVEKIRDDLVQRCSQFGSVRKAVLHDRNEQGVVQITFAESGECSLALSQLDGRVFRSGRVLKAEVWDGRSRYHVEETEEQAAQRRAIWERQVLGQKEDGGLSIPSDNPSAPGLSISDNPSAPGLSISDNPSAPGLSISDNPSAPGLSISDNPSAPGLSISANQSAPAVSTVSDRQSMSANQNADTANAVSTDDEVLVSSEDDESD